MKPIMGRVLEKLILLAVCGFLSACCHFCKKCPEDAECIIIPSNAATGIEPGTRDTPLPPGSRVSYPLFEGDYFSATVPTTRDTEDSSGAPVTSTPLPGEIPRPAGSSDGGGAIEIDPARIRSRRTVIDIVSRMGFVDPTGGDTLTEEFLEVGPHRMNLGGGDILEVARINCEPGSPSSSNSFCNLNDDQQRQLIARATGMAAESYLDRNLTHYLFFQRPQHREWPPNPDSTEKLCVPDPNLEKTCIDVFIEHVVIAATSNPDGSVTTVNGRVFSKYSVTNQPNLSAAQAIEKAYKHFWKIPEISKYAGQPITEQSSSLVLLPYAHARQFDLGRLLEFQWPSQKTPQLRYAYRTTLYGNLDDEFGRHLEVASWRAWVDAETGDILQLIPQFAFAAPATITAKGKGWPVSPPATPVETEFRINNSVNTLGPYCLMLDGVFGQPKYEDSATYQGLPHGLPETFCSNSPDFAALPPPCTQSNSNCLCHQGATFEQFAYLHMNAYSHIDRYQRALDAALCQPVDSTNLTPCENGRFRVTKDTNDGPYVPIRIDINNDITSGIYATPGTHLVLAGIPALWDPDCSADYSPNLKYRPAAQDSTVIIHEFSHMVTDGLLSSRPDNWCNDPGSELTCPVPHSLDLVHDLADGFAALYTNTNWFGAWYSNVDPNDSNPRHNELNKSPRELNHESDYFPAHRNWEALQISNPRFGHKDYADGQIAGAALWAVAESMEKWLPVAGRTDLQISLLNVLPGFRYFPDACGAYKQGDDCDYPDDCDIDVYRVLHFLLRSLLENQVATGVTVSANKILAGFAKTGIFLVPPQCIRTGISAEPLDSYCPGEEKYGGAAVIEINEDWLDHGSGNPPRPAQDPPTFKIWTGPNFHFDGNDATETDDPPCNKFFKIALANNCKFEQNDLNHYMKETAYRKVDDSCHAEWKPDSTWTDFWNDVTQTSRTAGLSNLHYRVITSPTKDVRDDTLISSSEYPGYPMEAIDIYDRVDSQRVDPPFAILNNTGDPAPDSVSPTCN